MSQVDELIEKAKSLLDTPYSFGAEVDLNDPKPKSLDCSEYIQLCVYQITKNPWVDGSQNQFNACKQIPIRQGIATKGALLFKTKYSAKRGIYHVGISSGDGFVYNAKSKRYGTVFERVDGSWTLAGLIPIINYQEGLTMTQFEELKEDIKNLQTNINKVENKFDEYNRQRAQKEAELQNRIENLENKK